MSNRSLTMIVATTGVLTAAPAHAGGEIVDLTVDSCTTLNCRATVLSGTIKSTTRSAGKWVAEFYSGGNECVRIHVTSSDGDNQPGIPAFDLEATVVTPGGGVFQDDDGAERFRPLIKMNGSPDRGWYTVSIGHWNGEPIDGNFTLAYGRYNLNNPNCSLPTPPRFRAARAK